MGHCEIDQKNIKFQMKMKKDCQLSYKYLSI